jgi:hypothetical protein
MFDHKNFLILENVKILFVGNRKRNVYKIKIHACIRIKSCLVASINSSFLWHKRLSSISTGILSKLVKNKLVKGPLSYCVQKEKVM